MKIWQRVWMILLIAIITISVASGICLIFDFLNINIKKEFLSVFYPHNNMPYSDVVKIKPGMTIKEIEAIAGTPSQSLWFGTFEVRTYLYEEIDGDKKQIGIGFQDSIAISIQSR